MKTLFIIIISVFLIISCTDPNQDPKQSSKELLTLQKDFSVALSGAFVDKDVRLFVKEQALKEFD